MTKKRLKDIGKVSMAVDRFVLEMAVEPRSVRRDIERGLVRPLEEVCVTCEHRKTETYPDVKFGSEILTSFCELSKLRGPGAECPDKRSPRLSRDEWEREILGVPPWDDPATTYATSGIVSYGSAEEVRRKAEAAKEVMAKHMIESAKAIPKHMDRLVKALDEGGLDKLKVMAAPRRAGKSYLADHMAKLMAADDLVETGEHEEVVKYGHAPKRPTLEDCLAALKDGYKIHTLPPTDRATAEVYLYKAGYPKIEVPAKVTRQLLDALEKAKQDQEKPNLDEDRRAFYGEEYGSW